MSKRLIGGWIELGIDGLQRQHGYGVGGGDSIGNGGFGEGLVHYDDLCIRGYGYALRLGLSSIGYIRVSGVCMGMVYGMSRMIPLR